MPIKIKYDQLSFQKEFHESLKPKVYLSAGYGAGKTYSLIMKVLKLMGQNPTLSGGLLAPTYKMFKRDVLPTFKDICGHSGIKFRFNKSDSEFTFPQVGATVYVFHSEDDGDSIRGPNLAWGAINEVTMVSKGAFDAFLARIRLNKAKVRQLVMSGTPESFNWAYDYFIAEQRSDTDLIFGNTRENKYIAPDYVKMLEESYDKLMAEQYIDGKFVNLTGNRAAWAFDRKKHVSTEATKEIGWPILVSMDFNINPMSAVLWQDFSGNLVAFDEISLMGSNTHEFCRVLREKLGGSNDVTIYPDPAGQSRSTKSNGKSDIDILKEHGFRDIRHKSASPTIRDALNALNNMLDKDRIRINPICKQFIGDLEQCVIKAGGFEIDKRDPKRTHWIDGAKYFIDYEYPIVARVTGAREMAIR